MWTTGASFRFEQINGIRMRLAAAGETEPLVIMVHGWPESWFSWRHPIRALPEAGHRIQQECPQAVNAALLRFVRALG